MPALEETAIARIIAGMWDNLGRVAAEYPHLRHIRVFEPSARVETHRGALNDLRTSPASSFLQ